MSSRRKFIRNVSLTAASAALIPSITKADKKIRVEQLLAEGGIVLSTWKHGLNASVKAV